MDNQNGMDNQFSEVLFDKLKNLIFDINKKISLEEEAKDLERLNEIIAQMNNSLTNETQKLQKEKREIEERICQRAKTTDLQENAARWSKPGMTDELAEEIKALRKS